MTEAPREPHPQAAPPARHGPAGYLVAAWLAATAARFAWAAYAGFTAARVPWWSKIATAAVALLAAAAVVPFLRFRRSGWEMAMWVLVTALVMDVARIVMGEARWLPAALAAGATAFSLGYAWRTRAAFRDPDEVAHEQPAAPSAAAPASPAERQTTAAEDALAAIHRRIVEAGSACAVTREGLLAEAARFGVDEDAVRTGGISLYRTFLDHFRRRGALTPEQERELTCLRRALDLDDDAVDRLHAGEAAAAPEPEPAEEPPSPVEEPAAPVEEPTLAIPEPVVAEGMTELEPGPGPEVLPVAPVEPEGTMDTPGLAGRAAAELADYEQHELSALLSWAGIGLPPGADPRETLRRLRAFHRISTEPLEEVSAGQALEPGERCFAVRTVELYRVSPGAQPSEAPPAPRPVDPRALVDGTLEEDCDLSPFGRAGMCSFLVTDRRLLLVAPSGQQSPLPLDRIRSVHPYRNGLQVRPLRGNPVFLAFRDGVDDAAMRISRVLNDVRAS